MSKRDWNNFFKPGDIYFDLFEIPNWDNMDDERRLEVCHETLASRANKILADYLRDNVTAFIPKQTETASEWKAATVPDTIPNVSSEHRGR